MLQSAVLCSVILLAACNATPAKTYSQFKSYPYESGHEVKDYSTRQREKRVAGVLGAILGKAILINRSSVRSLYIKAGGLKQAKEDFKAFNPTNIKYDVVVVSGKSGRDYIQLQDFHDGVYLKIKEANPNGFYKHTIQYYD